ncbi:MAG: peptidase, partial [Gemmatimonadetes bacterium]|nr:peptidase [Gemmatimonadota bacterium]
MSRRAVSALCALLLIPATSVRAGAQPRLSQITTPQAELGFEIGTDYHLADYTQLMAYWAKLARESDRMVLDTIGVSEEGRPQLMAIITSPENQRGLSRYREIAERLAKAEGVTEEEAWRLASEGKAVVWIDGGLHASEVLGAQQLMQLVYDMVSLADAETMRFLDDIIILAVHTNPDGMELLSDWYMREADPLARTTSGIPVLYEQYAGHDNNRDFFMANLAETQNMNRVAYTEWFPQIVYNHHQTGPAGTVMFSPPFRD